MKHRQRVRKPGPLAFRDYVRDCPASHAIPRRCVRSNFSHSSSRSSRDSQISRIKVRPALSIGSDGGPRHRRAIPGHPQQQLTIGKPLLVLVSARFPLAAAQTLSLQRRPVHLDQPDHGLRQAHRTQALGAHMREPDQRRDPCGRGRQHRLERTARGRRIGPQVFWEVKRTEMDRSSYFYHRPFLRHGRSRHFRVLRDGGHRLDMIAQSLCVHVPRIRRSVPLKRVQERLICVRVEANGVSIEFESRRRKARTCRRAG